MRHGQQVRDHGLTRRRDPSRRDLLQGNGDAVLVLDAAVDLDETRDAAVPGDRIEVAFPAEHLVVRSPVKPLGFEGFLDERVEIRRADCLEESLFHELRDQNVFS